MLKKRKCDKVKRIRPAPQRAEAAAYAIKSFLALCRALNFQASSEQPKNRHSTKKWNAKPSRVFAILKKEKRIYSEKSEKRLSTKKGKTCQPNI